MEAQEKVGKGSQTKLEWVQQLERDGVDTSGMLPEEPELFQDLVVYLNAFYKLTSSRSSGMGIGSIPLQAYESYFRIFGIDSLEEQLDYLKFVGTLDSEYLKYYGEESEKKRKQQGRRSKSNSKGRMSRQ